MKKTIALLSLIILMGTTTAILAQDKTPEQRKEIRAQRQAEYTTKLTAAIAAQNFTFVAQQYQSPYGPMMPINSLQNYITFDPGYMDVNLPYVASSPLIEAPIQMDFSAFKYKYDAVVNGTMAYITVVVENAQNIQKFNVPQNLTYTMHIQIYMATGNTVVTLVPSFNTQIQYFGTIQFN